MMQSLLKERFKLDLHTETQQRPIYALTSEAPGKLGPQLHPHSDTVPCAAPPQSPLPVSTGAKRPLICGIDAWRTDDGQMHWRMVNVTMEQIAGMLSGVASAVGGMENRPFVDQTGLSGKFDLDLEFAMQKNGPPDPQSDLGGPTAAGAIKKQLGFKLVKQTGPVKVLVIDHVEKLSEN
jgi:uncharacterized protein (TIGR03435 family)